MSLEPHIVHLIFSFETGGAESMLADIVNEQVAYARITLIIIKNKINEALLQTIDRRATVIRLNRDPQRYSKVGLFLKIQSLLLNLAPTIVHIHEESLLSLFPRVLRVTPFKLYLTVHDTGRHVPKTVLNADTVFAISRSVQADLLSRLHLHSRLNYNGVCTSGIVRKTRYGLNDPFRIVQISRLMHTKKGQHILLDAAALLAGKSPVDLQIDFIGEGESLEHLRHLAQELKIDSRVHFLGNQPKREIYKTLHEYDLLVQPSLYEGFGLTVVEGMLAGVPVLVSDVEGPLEIIHAGEFGFSFRRDDAESCAEQILDIIHRYRDGTIEDRAALANGHARRHFDIQRTAKAYALAETPSAAVEVDAAFR